ncbi:MAG: ABC transporter permease subunit [Trueperaceae bacterium]|nr:ABC transporter permease subunit [Trueperaceae bacterium]
MKRRARVVLGLAPALATLALVFGSALFGSLLQSLGHAPHVGIEEFPTLRHYRDVFTDPATPVALARTLLTALPATLIGSILGVAVGLAWPARRGLAGALAQLPLLVPYVVAVALATLWLAPSGVVSRTLAASGLLESPQAFPRILDGAAPWGVIATLVWKQIPFTALLVASLRSGADRLLDDVAVVFGASRFQRFRYVTWPSIWPAVVAGAVITLAYNLGALEVPLLLDGGTRDTLAVRAWRAYADADVARRPEAMAFAWSMTALALLAAAALLALGRRVFPGDGR